VGQRDYTFVFIVGLAPKVRKDGEDLGRDLVDWRDAVLPGPNQVEDLESVSLKNVDLDRCNTYQSQSTRPFRSFNLGLV